MGLKSWLASANDPGSDFPIQNLPYGVFRSAGDFHIGVAIGDRILDLHACAESRAAGGIIRGNHRRMPCAAPQSAHGCSGPQRGPLCAAASPRCSTRKGRPRDAGPRKAAPVAHRRSGDEASRGDWRLHRLLRLHRSRHAGGQAVSSRPSPAAQLQVHSHRLSRPRIVHRGQRNRDSQAVRTDEANGRRAGLRADASARLRIGGGHLCRSGQSTWASQSRSPMPRITSSACAWSTTGRRATSSRGSISRWGPSWQKASPPRSLHGSFLLKRWLPTVFPLARTRIRRPCAARVPAFYQRRRSDDISPVSTFGWRLLSSRAACAKQERRRCS